MTVNNEDCYGEFKDAFNNVISWDTDANEGLINFYANGRGRTTWVYEDDPELSVNCFMEIWNRAQIIAIRSLKLGTKEVAEFVLKSSCDGAYSQEDIELVTNDLKHVDVWLSNIATRSETEKDLKNSIFKRGVSHG